MEAFFLTVDHLFLVIDRFLVNRFKNPADKVLTQSPLAAFLLHAL